MKHDVTEAGCFRFQARNAITLVDPLVTAIVSQCAS